MSLTPYAVNFRGHLACPCQVEWIPAYEAELQRRGILHGPIRIYQLIGGAEASGGTHVYGGASDFLDLPGDEDVKVAREMGADATWSRPHNWDGHDGMPHVHSVLTGCPHVLRSTVAANQITAVRAGFNGLGHLGRGAKDQGPRPLSGRTWREGIEWAKEQDMPSPKDWDEQDWAAIEKRVPDMIWARKIKAAGNRVASAVVAAIADKVGAK